MSLPPVPISISPHPMLALEVTGVVTIGMALLVSARCLHWAWQREKFRRRQKENGVMQIIAWQAVRSEAVTLAVQLVLLSISITGTVIAPTDEGTWFHGIAGTGRVVASLLLAMGSVRDLRDRRRVNRLLAA